MRNLYYNDTIGKREFLNELLISTIMLKQWGNKELEGASEKQAVIIDIQGQFSCYKFVEKLREYYENQ